MNIRQRLDASGKCRSIGNFEPGSAAWLKQRREGITGSDIAPILGLSPFTSALTLFYRKTGQLLEQEPTTRMMLGNYLEEGIAKLYQDLNPNMKIHRNLGTFCKADAPVFRANPDAVVEDKLGNLSVLEIKHTSQHWTELPIHYRLQVNWYQYVLGLHNPAIVVAVTGGDLRDFVVEYDESLMQEAVKASEGFLGLLSMGVEPDYDGSSSTYETVRELSPDLKDEELELSCATELLAAKQIFDAAEANLNKYKSQAIAELDGVRVGTLNGLEIVRLQQRGSGKPFITFTKGN